MDTYDDAKVRTAASRRIAGDPLVQEAIKAEPLLLKVFALAAQSRCVKGYNRVERYYDLKELAALFVGWDGSNVSLGDSVYYDAVIGVISDLVPADSADADNVHVQPGGDRVAAILETRPIREPQPEGETRFTFLTVEDLASGQYQARVKAEADALREWVEALEI